MTEKSRDKMGRWRSVTIGFRVSPEENEAINQLVALSGLSKQDYILNKLKDKEITVLPNPRAYKGVKKLLEQIYQKLCEAEPAAPDSELKETIRIVANVVNDMK